MTRLALLIGIAFATASCGFGDNLTPHEIGPDAGGGGGGHVDSGVETQHDAPEGGSGSDSGIVVTACTLFPQSGCSTGDACDFTEDDSATTCRDVDIAGTSKSLCAALTDCAIGYTCVTDSATMDSCMPFCDHDTDCSGVGSRCVVGLEDSNGNSLDVDVCSTSCGLETGNGCPTGMGCLGFEDGNKDYTDCEVVGHGAEFASCTDDTDCSPGTSCTLDSDGDAECLAYCEVNNANACGGDGCTEFATPLTIGSIEWGYCDDEDD